MAIRPALPANLQSTLSMTDQSVDSPSTVTNVTWMGWIYLDAITAGGIDIFSIQHSLFPDFSDDYIWLGTQADGQTLILEVLETAGADVSGTGSLLPVGAWCHLAYVKTGNDHALYLSLADGTKDCVLDISFTNPISFAAQQLFTNVYKSVRMAYVRVWEAALTPAEIRLERDSQIMVRTANRFVDSAFMFHTWLNNIGGSNNIWTASHPLETVPGPPTLLPTPVSGALLVLSENAAHKAAMIEPTAGGVLAQVYLSVCDTGGSVPGVTLGLFNKPTSTFDLVGPDFQPITSLAGGPINLNASSPITSDQVDTFYGLQPLTGTRRIHLISEAGVVGGTTWVLTGAGTNYIRLFAVSLDETIFYWATTAVGSGIHRHDLATNLALPDLIADGGTHTLFGDMFVVNGGAGLILTYKPAGSPQEVRLISTTTGATLQTFPLSADDGVPVFLAIDYDDPAVFWVKTNSISSIGISRYHKFRLADAVLLRFFQIDNTNGTGVVPYSCPFFVLQFGIPPLITGCPPANLGPRPVNPGHACAPSTPSV